MEKRIYFLDHLRSAIILLVVVFHAALAYMVYAPEWWYVVDTKRVLAADLFVVWADIFIMPIMFFLSGYFGIQSLSKKSQRIFWLDKWKRIGLPWIFGAMVIAPHTAYLMIASRDIPMTFWEFYTKLFWGAAYQQSQYWYLGALMAFYVLLAIACTLWPHLRQRIEPGAPSAGTFWGLGFLGAFGVGIVNAVYSDGTWIHPLYVLVLQPTRVPLYLLYFALGVVAWRRHWFTEKGYSPSLAAWGPLFLLTSLVYVSHKFYSSAVLGVEGQTYLILNAIVHSFFCLSAVFGLIALFKQFCTLTTPVWAALSATSYPIYYIHQTVVQELNWMVRPLETNAFMKYLLVCGLALTACYLISQYILLRIPSFGPARPKVAAKKSL